MADQTYVRTLCSRANLLLDSVYFSKLETVCAKPDRSVSLPTASELQDRIQAILEAPFYTKIKGLLQSSISRDLLRAKALDKKFNEVRPLSTVNIEGMTDQTYVRTLCSRANLLLDAVYFSKLETVCAKPDRGVSLPTASELQDRIQAILEAPFYTKIKGLLQSSISRDIFRAKALDKKIQ